MDDLLSFVKDARPLERFQSHERIMLRIAQQVTECGYFIREYCADGFGEYPFSALLK